MRSLQEAELPKPALQACGQWTRPVKPNSFLSHRALVLTSLLFRTTELMGSRPSKKELGSEGRGQMWNKYHPRAAVAISRLESMESETIAQS